VFLKSPRTGLQLELEAVEVIITNELRNNDRYGYTNVYILRYRKCLGVFIKTLIYVRVLNFVTTREIMTQWRLSLSGCAGKNVYPKFDRTRSK